MRTQPTRRKPISSEQKRMLEQQRNLCLYCSQPFGKTVLYRKTFHTLRVHWDHILPFAYSLSNAKENFAAACQFCNQWKSSFVFNSLEEIRNYVGEKWKLAGLPSVRATVPEGKEVAKVLQAKLPVQILEQEEWQQPKRCRVCHDSRCYSVLENCCSARCFLDATNDLTRLRALAKQSSAVQNLISREYNPKFLRRYYQR